MATVSEIIDQRPLSRFQISTILLCGLVMLLDGFDTQSVGFLAPPMAESLGIPISAFGPVFAAGLFGLMVGAMASGAIADRWGRKWPLIVCTMTFGALSLLTPSVTSLDELILVRFLTGLGLGGAMPNVVALSSEYAPRRLQAILVPTIFVGMGAGAMLAATAGQFMLPRWGWPSVFYVGGILPVALAVVLVWALPESVRFLSVRGERRDRVAAILRRIAPDAAVTPLDVSAAQEQRAEGLPMKHLFTEGRAAGTLLLWVPFFMNLLILYFILSWLPALLRAGGLPVSAGITAVMMFSLGGIIGTIVQGPFMAWMAPNRVMLAEFVATTLLVWTASSIFGSFPAMIAVTFVLGVVVQGAQAGLNALAAMFYPTAIRSTGVGWALGVGRVGSIVGPLIGGAMLSLSWTPQQIFVAGAIPALLAAAAVALSGRMPGTSPYRVETASDFRQRSSAATPAQ